LLVTDTPRRKTMPDEKVKAESEDEVIDVSPLLSIDSPMVVWRGDLKRLVGGGGGSGEVGGSGSGTGEPSPAPTTVEYIATCDAVFHDPGEPGAIEGGRWFGAWQRDQQAALDEARQHLDGHAYVGMYIEGVLVGPVVRP
jgi:hypothetical protein